MCSPTAQWVTTSLVALALAGCGLSVPQVQEIWDSDIPPVPGAPKLTGTAQIEYEIQRKVYCELKDAVIAAENYNVTQSASLSGKQSLFQKGLIPLDWGAQIALESRGG